MYDFKMKKKNIRDLLLNFNAEVILPLVNVHIHANIYGFRSNLHTKQRNTKWFSLNKIKVI